nr:Mov34/MPN/PAD-1 family protein [Oceanococcus sp. HetDA_MAG_MS8]
MSESWVSMDGRRLLHLSTFARRVFETHRQLRALDLEAGGILLGTVHGSHLAITHATTPTTSDRRCRAFFRRAPHGHAQIAGAHWRRSRGQIRYLGEWHTHAERDPCPSNIDYTEWQRLAAIRADKQPVVAVIVGTVSLYVARASASGKVECYRPL